MYWHLPYPYGIADVKREDFIGLDGCGVFVETADKHIGKAYTGNRVRQAGNYQKSEKWNLLLGIAGSEAAERWAEMWLEGGTTNIKMIEFIQKVLVDIGAGTPLRRRCFIMDNLNSHHNAQMAALIIAAGHRLAYRAPYYPVDGPIEFVFNTVQGHLMINMHKVKNNGVTLCNETRAAIASIPTFIPYFEHCGYVRV